MFIFALISTGTLYTMVSVLQTTRDSRAQQVAANLAAQDIDLARDYANLFQLLPTTYTVPLNGDTSPSPVRHEWVSRRRQRRAVRQTAAQRSATSG